MAEEKTGEDSASKGSGGTDTGGDVAGEKQKSEQQGGGDRK